MDPSNSTFACLSDGRGSSCRDRMLSRRKSRVRSGLIRTARGGVRCLCCSLPHGDGCACRAESPCCSGLVRCPPPAPKPNAAEAHTGKGDAGHRKARRSFGELRVWSEDGRIYLAEPGKPAQELRLGDTVEARHLRQLLERDGATAGIARACVRPHDPRRRRRLRFRLAPRPKRARRFRIRRAAALAGSGRRRPVNSRQLVPAETPRAAA